jgi:hypothetical protein
MECAICDGEALELRLMLSAALNRSMMYWFAGPRLSRKHMASISVKR